MFVSSYFMQYFLGAYLFIVTIASHICRANFILFIATFLSECLCLSQLVFYEEQRTWNEAYTICEKNGGLPMSIDSQEKYDLLDTFSNERPWNSVNKLDKKKVWIGLHYTDSAGTKLAWADCSSVSWTKWHPSQPKSTSTNKCVYLKTIASNFWTDVCSSQLYFICENLDSSSCTTSLRSCYEATIGVTGQSVDGNTNNNPRSSCYDSELTTSTNTDSTSPKSVTSALTTLTKTDSTSPNSVTSALTTSTKTDSTSPNSVTSALTTSTKTDSTSPNSVTSALTTSTKTDSTSPNSVTSALTTSTKTDSTSPNSVTSALTTSTKTDSTSPNSVTSALTASTKTDSTSPNSVTSALTLSTHSATYNLPQTMSSFTLYSETKADSTTSSTYYTTSSVGECSCKCMDDGANMTETVLQSKIEARKKYLTVDKQSLSSTIRKKESAEDPRPSAKGIGTVGVVFIVFIIGGIVIPDLYSLYVHVCMHIFKAKQYSKTNDKLQANNECIEQNDMV